MAPKGLLTYAFTHMGDFLFLLLLLHPFPPSQAQGSNPSPETQISASRLGFGPGGLDLGFKTGILASRLGFEGGGIEEEEKQEKIPHMCESIGH